MRRAAAAIVAAAALAGCAGGFQRPPPEALKLGETTQAELERRIGEPPMSKSTMVRNGRNVDVVTWVFASDFEKPHGYSSIIAGRTLTLFFDQGRLVGHEFNSTFDTDHTDFSVVSLFQVQRGKTTREQVRQMFGAPAGSITFPLVDTPGGALVYNYRETRRVPFGQPLTFVKTLLFKFNEDGTVNDYAYQISGTP